MVAFNAFVTLAALASGALAHFTLDYPLTRGFDEDLEPQFCGGFNSVNNRTQFPLSGGSIFIDSHHPSASVQAVVSLSTNPTGFSAFNTTSNGTEIPSLTNFFQLKSSGEFCWTVDFTSLNLGITNGTEVTLMIQFNGGDGNLYQCADLVLIDGLAQDSKYTCSVDATTNPTGTVNFAGATSTSAASAATSAAQTSQATSASGAASASASASGAAVPRLDVSMGLLGAIAGIVGAYLF